MEIPTREDFGMVWMGDMLLQNESNDMMMEPVADSPFFVDPNAQALSDDEIRCRNQMGMEGFMMLEDLDESARWYVNGVPEEMMMENDASNSSKVVTTATQTGIQNAPPGSRKIRPVKHPGLKLQTPIAYQRDTDLNVIPIQKEGRAVCKKCGAIGVKHAFYTRERRYCSLACARGFVDTDSSGQEASTSPPNQWSEESISQQQQEQQPPPPPPPPPPPSLQSIPHQFVENPQPQTMFMCNQPHFMVQQPSSIIESQLPPPFTLPPEEPPYYDKRQHASLTCTHNWTPQLTDPFFSAAPTSCFQHAPMADLWHYIDVGLKVEVENTDSYDFCDEFPNSFWIASVLRVEGYKALLRYEGFVGDDSKDFWVNLCSSLIHPVGWCAVRGKPLIPPKSIKDKYSNWKEFLKRRLTGARTLPSNFYSKVLDSLKSRFRCDLTVEVVDKSRISQVKVATIEKITGKRLQLRYYDSKPNSAELFWCHEDSPLIHPVGWAKRIGQKLDASPEYQDRMMKGLREKDDATADLFETPERVPLPPNCYFQEGMKLEAIDPLNLGDICVATVMQVLNDGYLMIRVDFWNDQHPSTDDWFCYHMSSPCIFPAGFCVSNGIPLTPPKDYDKMNFDWNRYLQETGCVAAPPQLFNQEIPDHGFKVGMKVEAADLMNPRLVCVATIVQVIGRLLKVHFDGWETDFDQWVDCKSCDIYPVGWCELVEHKLEPPFSESKTLAHESRSGGRPKKKGRGRHVSGNTAVKHETSKMGHHDEKENEVHMNSASHVTLSSGQNGDVNAGSWCSSQIARSNFDTNRSTGAESKPFTDNEANSVALARVNISSTISANTSGTQQSSPPVILTEQNAIMEKPKVIPRLSDYKSRGSSLTVTPETWDVNDVVEFLKINDCSTYCEAFIKQAIDGRKLVELTKDEVLSLAGMKVGPSLKIQNLITQLTSKANPGHSRYNKLANKNIL